MNATAAVLSGAGPTRPRHGATAALVVGAIGVVYGDIGTSPLYALKEAVRAALPSGLPTTACVTGAVSTIFWSLILVVSLKYAVLILQADNKGEGGVVAMLALLKAREAAPGTARAGLLVVGLIGAALLYGDGAITPAVSVLSAVEGLEVDAPSLKPAVLPIAVAILIGLFLVQRQGTGFIGRIFGPTMIGWFLVIALLGLRGIATSPAILHALNPASALSFAWAAPPWVTFGVLGAAFLAVTGGEAMYADMGHFGRFPIRAAWFGIALPALTLNYFGQGGLLLADPATVQNPFFQLAPRSLHYPLIAFATVATVIASQAIISGAFSLSQQAIQLGFLPRMAVRHTGHEMGQIYMPEINWALAVATVAAVLLFRSSDALAGAYGLAVSLLMAITTLLATLVALQWGYSLAVVAVVNGAFLLLDLVFFAANGVKLLEGGWFPLLLASAVAFLMLTWRKGQAIIEARRALMRQPEDDLVRTLQHEGPLRLPGTAAFMTAATTGVPLPLTQFMRHTHALHERVLLLTVVTKDTPRVSPEKRVEVAEHPEGLIRVILYYGFAESSATLTQDVARAVEDGRIRGVHAGTISYVIGRETIIPTRRHSGMARWREAIFAVMHRNSERPATYFGVPADQVVELGTEIEI
jgi:KUP system potassium uptake protein